MRCAALAMALRSSGWRIGAAWRPGTTSTVPFLASAVEDSVELVGEPNREAAEMEGAWPDGVDLLVVDHYERGAEFEQACRPWTQRILVIDDLASRPHDCDVLLDQTLGRERRHYAGLLPEDCQLLLGPRFALLRPQFCASRAKALAQRRLCRTLSRVLVCFGSTDPDNATLDALRAIEESGLDLSVDIVLGAESAHSDSVRARAAAASIPVKVHVDVTDMAVLMAHADIAIGAAGVSSWERCCCSLPTLVLTLAENQTDVADELAQAGAVVNLGMHSRRTRERIVKALIDLHDAPCSFREMADKASRICDGRGVQRTQVELLGRETARDGLEVGLRLIESDDRQVTFAWQSMPETRRFSLNSERPSWAEHSAWFEGVLASPTDFTLVILHGREPSGIVRLDRIGQKDAFEVSIYVVPAKYRRGLGRAGLVLARALVPGARLHATVLPENEASQRLFRSVGYRVVSTTLLVDDPTDGPDRRGPHTREE